MLAIITVIYRNYQILDDFFASLQAQSSGGWHCYVADLTPASQRQVVIFPDTRYTLITGDNKGYAHGVNLGVDRAISDNYTQYAIVNPDTILDSDYVKQALMSLSEHPHTIIGGLIYYAPGYEYHKRPNAPDHQLSIWYAGGKIDWSHVTAKHIGVDDYDHPMYHIEGETDFATGCSMLYDKSVYDELKRWDEGYFMYYEDLDYCLRARSRHIPVIYAPSIVMQHKNAQSTGGSGSDFHSRAMQRSRVRFGLKYAPLRTKMHIMKNRLLGRRF